MKLVLKKKHILKAIQVLKHRGSRGDLTTCCPLWQAFHEKTGKVKFFVGRDVIMKDQDVLYQLDPALTDELYTSYGWSEALTKAPYTFNLNKVE